jgi:tRNA (cmo5U34)-methyltransferase
LETDEDKMRIYKKIFNALNDNGSFVNIDIVLGSNERLQKINMEKWKDFLKKEFTEERIQKDFLTSYYKEDKPAKLISHLEMLKECGFPFVDVIFKRYGCAVYCAEK